MQLTITVWSLISLAVFAANLPFLNQRIFAVIRLSDPSKKKPLCLRLLELLVYYFIMGGGAYLLESSMGNIFPQSWEFFAISGCLFIVFAFPGFVFQYLCRR